MDISLIGGGRFALALVMVSPMSSMHEDMHQRTGEQQQIRQGSNDMGKVLGEQEVDGDPTDYHQADCIA
ncbi:hypothetical protein HB13667_09780 [Pseudomonas putida]|uniref:Uncharacterized protein n=3 Tax=Pseudomonas TaxID=286 RepID=A0AA34RU62_PSEPU|nr:hypothetical protein B479_00365 [Pseudomonas putida HB3267]AGZ32834.1 hypothetical protein PVLB_00120 [Pseudomonas sp. VLB120]AIN61143.1 hypothetical protein O165_023580 [Pseudomonas soli]AJA13530.1 hypothetical protein RPPX_09320 [Pseudomonas putida S12]AOX06837.1 hypothetical protein Q5O_00120 [Pseudomonas putida JB]ESW36595.1 hypothetical protein O164_28935 [Pseudomonas taiwanensis SJ9]KPM60940.1 hypothetical protein HB4184_20090 [Pseudomonas putida]KXK67516.1 hypothetical protein BC89